MKKRSYRVTMVNHAAIEIAATSDVVWGEIVELFVDGRGWREKGYTLNPLDEPWATLGGYRMLLEKEGIILDERICNITERDEGARRLSLYADYLSVPEGMQVYVTYQARELAIGTCFTLDCHSRMSVEATTNARDEVAVAIESMKTQSDTYLTEYLQRTKAKLEEAHGTSRHFG